MSQLLHTGKAQRALQIYEHYVDARGPQTDLMPVYMAAQEQSALLRALSHVNSATELCSLLSQTHWSWSESLRVLRSRKLVRLVDAKVVIVVLRKFHHGCVPALVKTFSALCHTFSSLMLSVFLLKQLKEIQIRAGTYAFWMCALTAAEFMLREKPALEESSAPMSLTGVSKTQAKVRNKIDIKLLASIVQLLLKNTEDWLSSLRIVKCLSATDTRLLLDTVESANMQNELRKHAHLWINSLSQIESR